MYDIISSWKVEQNQAVKAATQGKASPAKIQTPGKELMYGQRKPSGASDNRFIFKKKEYSMDDAFTWHQHQSTSCTRSNSGYSG